MIGRHFAQFAHPEVPDRLVFKRHVLRCFEEHKSYTLGPVHTLEFLFEPRYVDDKEQPDVHEASAICALLQSLAAAHDVKAALAKHSQTAEGSLPADYDRTEQTKVR